MTKIAHAAALTDEDVVPFEHGVALARASGGKLFSIHARQGDEGAAELLLDATAVLKGWGDSATTVDAEGVTHECCDDPVDTLLDALTKLQPDLVIAATHQREGIARALVGSRAEAIAHNVSVPTLLLPVGAKGFVSRDDGKIDLQRILVPLGDDAEAKAAVEAAVAIGRMAGATEVELVLLRVGSATDTPDVTMPDVDGWKVSRTDVPDEKLEDAILAEAEDACLVVMATRGHDSIGDVIRGSHTDRVLHRANCPVLSVPVK
jgi:nucleotide-binding universal stress UspA family protein